MRAANSIFTAGDGTYASASRKRGFTLLEILIASAAATMILISIYGLFSRAVRMRDAATENNRETRLRVRALSAIRGDLRNGLVSGGIFASALEGDTNGSGGSSGGGNSGDASFPGYLKLTTTNGKDTPDAVFGDVQQVEYYIIRDPNSTGPAGSGVLVRATTRDLLDNSASGQGSSMGGSTGGTSLSGSATGATQEEQILTGVKSMEVAFYDGSTWQPSWVTSGSNVASAATSGTNGTSGTSATTSGSASTSGTAAPPQILPYAVRVDIHMMPQPGKTEEPPPLEVLVPWSNAPFLSGTNYIIGTDSISTDTGATTQ